jgi:hypothetical protein
VSIKEAKLVRIEEEQKEEDEEKERLAKKKKEEEEFSKMPDDTNNVSQDNTNTTHHANTTMTDLKNEKGKANKAKGKDVDNVETINGPYNTAKKGGSGTEPQTDEKLMKEKNAAKASAKASAKANSKNGKASGEEKSSGDSD